MRASMVSYRVPSVFGLISLLCLISFCSAGSQLTGGGYYCNVLCLVGQLQNGQNRDLASLKATCKKYDRTDFCHAGAANCKKDCGDLKMGSGSSPSSAPRNVRANYTTDPEPNPYKVDVAWDRVSGADLYVIEYFQAGENGAVGRILGHEESTDTKAVISRDKNALCVRYGFRVAAVNQNGIGPFSDDVVLDKPVPIYKTRPTYKLKSLVYTDKEYRIDEVGEQGRDPNTVEATVEYTLPPNWRPTDFVSPPNEYVHNLMCRRIGLVLFTTRSNLSTDRAELVIPFPGNIVQSDCTYLFTLFGLNTVCGTTAAFPDPFDSNGTNAADIGIFINISCTAVTNAPCKVTNESKQASCAVKDFGYNITSKTDQGASVALSWGDVRNAKSWPVQYYVVKYSLSEKPSSGPVFVLPIVKNVGLTKTCSGPGACDVMKRTVTIDHLELGRYFVAQVCAVYDPVLDSAIPWDIVPQYPIDLTMSATDSTSGGSATMPGAASSRTSASTGVNATTEVPPAQKTTKSTGSGAEGRKRDLNASLIVLVSVAIFLLKQL